MTPQQADRESKNMPIQLTVGDTSLRAYPAAALNGVPLPLLNPETSR